MFHRHRILATLLGASIFLAYLDSAHAEMSASQAGRRGGAARYFARSFVTICQHFRGDVGMSNIDRLGHTS
jgi:hypothetical protein